jgi:hypothetical protein
MDGSLLPTSDDGTFTGSAALGLASQLPVEQPSSTYLSRVETFAVYSSTVQVLAPSNSDADYAFPRAALRAVLLPSGERSLCGRHGCVSNDVAEVGFPIWMSSDPTICGDVCGSIRSAQCKVTAEGSWHSEDIGAALVELAAATFEGVTRGSLSGYEAFGHKCDSCERLVEIPGVLLGAKARRSRQFTDTCYL